MKTSQYDDARMYDYLSLRFEQCLVEIKWAQQTMKLSMIELSDESPVESKSGVVTHYSGVVPHYMRKYYRSDGSRDWVIESVVCHLHGVANELGYKFVKKDEEKK